MCGSGLLIVTIKVPIRHTKPTPLHFLKPAKLANGWFAVGPGTLICLTATIYYELQSDGEEEVMEGTIILDLEWLGTCKLNLIENLRRVKYNTNSKY